MLNHSLVARQLWCWVPQWKYDLGTLMKCVCKVLINHPLKTQHFIMIGIAAAGHECCWGLIPTKAKTSTLKERLILPPFVVGGFVIIHSIHTNWRIRVIKPFKCLFHSKFFLPQNWPPPRLCSEWQDISWGHQMFYGKWLGNLSFYQFSLKDLCTRAFWASL